VFAIAIAATASGNLQLPACRRLLPPDLGLLNVPFFTFVNQGCLKVCGNGNSLAALLILHV